MRPGHPRLTNGLTYQAILGSNLCELWHCGASVATSGTDILSWTGQVRGIVLTPQSSLKRPTYGVDSTYFKGRSVVQCAASNGSNLLSGVLGTPLGSSGDYPEMLIVGRNRIDPTGTDYDNIATLSSSVSGNGIQLLYSQSPANRFGTPPPSSHGYQCNYTITGPPVFNTYNPNCDDAKVTDQLWLEWVVNLAAPSLDMYVDGTFYSNIGGIGTPPVFGKVDTIEVGTASWGRLSNMSIALVAYLFNPITTLQRAQLHALIVSEFGGV